MFIPLILISAWLGGSLTIPLTPTGVTGAVLLIVTLMAAQVLPRVAWAFGTTAALAVVTAVAFTQLPGTRFGSVPALVLLAVAAGLSWLLTRPPRRQSPEEAWLTRLDGLLVGRYDVPRSRSAELVARARAEGAPSGPTPVARYAREAAAVEPARRRSGRYLLSVMIGTAVVGAAVNAQWVLAGAGAVVLAWSLWDVRTTLRRS
ncbi:hypothetical protein [Actinoplanes sp. NPDC048796]|uniref:hypothetical protein n=1 Tax=Actinoplanes sp. NPDC048796 TaxID=3155640 RepID=UPI0033FECF1C